MNRYKTGLRDGIPIALGYLSVSFALGIMAAEVGCTAWQAAAISLMNLTSAGEFAGITVMAQLGSLAEMALTQFIINLRYSLMAISLSQKTDSRFKGIWRAIFGYAITDEIFAVAYGCEGEVSRSYFAGLMSLPVAGWTLGTLLGALLGNVMPEFITNVLSIALYAMFIAIVVPKAKSDKRILTVVFMSATISLLLKYMPKIPAISSGFAIIICSVTASLAGALVFGGKGDTDNEA